MSELFLNYPHLHTCHLCRHCYRHGFCLYCAKANVRKEEILLPVRDDYALVCLLVANLKSTKCTQTMQESLQKTSPRTFYHLSALNFLSNNTSGTASFTRDPFFFFLLKADLFFCVLLVSERMWATFRDGDRWTCLLGAESQVYKPQFTEEVKHPPPQNPNSIFLCLFWSLLLTWWH